MKFKVGRLYQLVSGPDSTGVELYPEEALITKEHGGKPMSMCFTKIVLWDFKNGPFLIVTSNEGSPGDEDFYRILSSEGTAGWIRLPFYLGYDFEELKDDEE